MLAIQRVFPLLISNSAVMESLMSFLYSFDRHLYLPHRYVSGLRPK